MLHSASGGKQLFRLLLNFLLKYSLVHSAMWWYDGMYKEILIIQEITTSIPPSPTSEHCRVGLSRKGKRDCRLDTRKYWASKTSTSSGGYWNSTEMWLPLYLHECSRCAPCLSFLWAELGRQSNQSLGELQVVQHLHHTCKVLYRERGGEHVLTSNLDEEPSSIRHVSWGRQVFTGSLCLGSQFCIENQNIVQDN